MKKMGDKFSKNKRVENCLIHLRQLYRKCYMFQYTNKHCTSPQKAFPILQATISTTTAQSYMFQYTNKHCTSPQKAFPILQATISTTTAENERAS